MFRLPRLENWRDALALCLLLMAGQQMAGAAYIEGKAHLAQLLIGHAWQAAGDNTAAPVKPWAWADTWPVARLLVPGQGVDLYVLAGTTGNALAFGPGLEVASAEPGQGGVTVIGGHRDTHFAFLQALGEDDRLTLELPSRRRLQYRVAGIRVVDVRREPEPVASYPDELQLVTCYPFDAINPGGPLRYVVSAVPAAAQFTQGTYAL